MAYSDSERLQSHRRRKWSVWFISTSRMKRRTVASLIVLLGVAIAVFAFAPVVYSPTWVISCSRSILDLGPVTPCRITGSIPAYEPPSCALLGIGAAYDKTTTVGPRMVSSGEGISDLQHGKVYPAGDAIQIKEEQQVVQWSYYVGRPLKQANMT